MTGRLQRIHRVQIQDQPEFLTWSRNQIRLSVVNGCNKYVTNVPEQWPRIEALGINIWVTIKLKTGTKIVGKVIPSIGIAWIAFGAEKVTKVESAKTTPLYPILLPLTSDWMKPICNDVFASFAQRRCTRPQRQRKSSEISRCRRDPKIFSVPMLQQVLIFCQKTMRK